MNSKIIEALELMKDDLSRKVLLSQLASAVNLSVSHFSYLFSMQLGMPPGQYLMTLRMQRAAELLASSTLSVKEVMAKVGFNDKSDFARTFRKAYGVAPSEYRDAKIHRARRKEP